MIVNTGALTGFRSSSNFTPIIMHGIRSPRTHLVCTSILVCALCPGCFGDAVVCANVIVREPRSIDHGLLVKIMVVVDHPFPGFPADFLHLLHVDRRLASRVASRIYRGQGARAQGMLQCEQHCSKLAVVVRANLWSQVIGVLYSSQACMDLLCGITCRCPER